MPLPTLTDVKTHLNIPAATTGDDAELARFLGAAVDLCERHAGITIDARSRTQYDLGGQAALPLRFGPVTTVTSVTVDGATLAAADYELLRTGEITACITSTASTFGDSDDQVITVYSAGWTTLPKTVEHAVLETVRHLWATQRGAMSGRGVFDPGNPATVPGAAWSLPIRVEQILDALRGPGIG